MFFFFLVEEEETRAELLKNEERKPNANDKSARKKSSTPSDNIQMTALHKSKPSQSNLQNSSNDTNEAKTTAANNTASTQQLQKSPASATGQQLPHYETQVSKDFSFFLQQQKDSSQRALISPQVRFVMFQFLFTTVKPFTSEFLTKNVLELLFKRAIIKESRHTDSKMPPEYLYKYNKGCNYFILILSGEAVIEVGKEKLEFPAGPFAYFGVNALLCGRETCEQVCLSIIT